MAVGLGARGTRKDTRFHFSLVSALCTEDCLPYARHCQPTEELTKYEVEGDAIQSYAEFQLAASIYGCMIEGAASEQSARMQAMENATKNAGMYCVLALYAWKLLGWVIAVRSGIAARLA